MAMELNSKCDNYVEVDRISNLPDPLICHILSFIPTKQSVATSILSTRWKPLWTMVPALDFEDTEKPDQRYHDNNNRMTFIHFVCGVLAVRKPVPLKKFKLQLISPNRSIHFHVRAWIYYAIRHGVGEIDVRLFLRRPFELPQCVFSCKSLEIMTLYGMVVLNCHSESVYLPKVKHLRLLKVKYANEDSFHSLLTGSPHLQKLSVWTDQQDDTMALNICHPTVEWLSAIIEAQDHRFKLEINVPNLKFLNLVDSIFQYELMNNVVKATFDLFEDEHQASDLENYSLGPLADAHTLTLQYAKSPCFDFSLPMPNNLRSLQLQVRCCQWHLLPNLLESAPNLVNLIINMEDTEGPHELSWTEPLHVPKCLELRIRRISLLQFRSLEHEVELIKYILKNAKVLERMDILTGLSDLEESHHIFKIISELPKGSSACKLFLLNKVKLKGDDGKVKLVLEVDHEIKKLVKLAFKEKNRTTQNNLQGDDSKVNQIEDGTNEPSVLAAPDAIFFTLFEPSVLAAPDAIFFTLFEPSVLAAPESIFFTLFFLSLKSINYEELQHGMVLW